jgi:cell division septation protein DedD
MAETETDALRDTEITLGTGKLLGIFFGLVLLCALFFTMGYMLGHSNSASGKTEIIGSDSGGANPTKPSAVAKTGQVAPSNSGNPSGTPAPAVSPVAVSAATPATVTPASASGTPGTEVANVAPSGATYVVQVAAVSKREDADLMVSGLQKKQYPAFVVNASGDALFHVQVGPFNDPKDAETIRTRLVGEGYNPIVKRSN